MASLELTAGTATLKLETLDTPTASAITAILPLTSSANVWGDEVYFSVPVAVEKESTARDVIEPGEIAFWVEGSCIVIGFGPTPISEADEIRLAARTNIWATSSDDVRCLTGVQPGDPIRLKSLD